MHFMRQLSNPPANLQRVLDARRGTLVVRPSITSAPRRLGDGVVQRTVIKALMVADGPMRFG